MSTDPTSSDAPRTVTLSDKTVTMLELPFSPLDTARHLAREANEDPQAGPLTQAVYTGLISACRSVGEEANLNTVAVAVSMAFASFVNATADQIPEEGRADFVQSMLFLPFGLDAVAASQRQAQKN